MMNIFFLNIYNLNDKLAVGNLTDVSNLRKLIHKPRKLLIAAGVSP